MTARLPVAVDQALGTSMRVAAVLPDRLSTAKRAADRVVSAIDQTCSRFRENSELSALHRQPGREVSISPLLARALGVSLRAARLTGGLVDPTVGTAVKAAGYDRDFAAVPARGPAVKLRAAAVPGWERIRLEEARGRVFLPAGVEIDLGSTAKALAADMAALAACEAAGCGILVSLGGDVGTAGESPEPGWRVQVAEDSAASLDPDAETIAIRSGGIATSSTRVRRWVRGRKALHHIIDPRTGKPADGPWRTVTVVASSCVDANIAATAALVRGQEAVTWLSGLSLPARLVDGQGAVTRCAGWPQPLGAAATDPS